VTYYTTSHDLLTATEEQIMATITFKETPVNTCGTLPNTGDALPEFSLVAGDLSEANNATYAGKKIILNIVPSLDTGICQASARRFNEAASSLGDTVIINISMDLPFAQGRFCESEGLENVVNLSAFRSQNFGNDYGVTMVDGPLAGLFSRAVIVTDADGNVVYTEQVPEIVQEPDYENALRAVK